MEREWELSAACRDVDPNVFFKKDSLSLARRTCRACPVQEECLDAVLARESHVAKTQREGIFAALTGAQRWEVERQRKTGQPAVKKPKKAPGPGRKLSPCGTEGAYQRHQRKGEPADQACLDAHALTHREYRRTGSTKVLTSR
ncbi:WhiB family transcriptional regulator [Streptomyces sp. NBC_01571]|uniref:WhiB family transcriptional regulator n=1 Tax=Streptomyces sp. NBC_01571 TaxID=2975883 RepID=UPI0022584E0E|nr:WhiB family transcriptional regulator [Streptomyces sp. NBC_01571]MCX4575658.1 WhiB family transcriptional regulator [Streptomyces sp. NBC_01571]